MYENSRFLKNRFTFCGVNTNFGQQWAPPAYYHLTPIVSKGKHWHPMAPPPPRNPLSCDAMPLNFNHFLSLSDKKNQYD